MIRSVLLAAAAALAPTLAGAQTVVARSGEHDGFSRIVLQMPQGAEWSLERGDRMVRLTVDQQSLRFDTSKVFERIPRTRLTALEQTEPGGDLTFTLGCDCAIDEFVQSGRFLVIDIADARPEEVAPGGTDVVEAPADPLTLPVLPDSSLAMLKAPAPAGADDTPPRPASGTASTVSVGLNRSEERLLEQIDRAMDQGLLEPRRRLKADDSTPADHAAKDVELPTEIQGNQVGVSVRNALDEGLARVRGNGMPAADAPTCLSGKLVAVQDWGTERPFSAQVSDLRALLYGEFDRVNPEAVLGLARLYLYFGFGAEAAGVLDLGRQNDLETRIIEALSDIMDGEDTREPNPFAGQQDCDGDVALWSVLAAGTLARPFDADAILLAFARLPAHLKSHLGPGLVRRFSDAGETDMASAILIATTRSGDATDPALIFAEASLDRARGNVEGWSGGMSEVIGSGSAQAPQAVIELIEATWESRGAIPPDMPVLLDAYALEYRDAAIGPDLRRAQVLALSLAGDVAGAQDRLAQVLAADGPEAQDAALLPFLTLLVERGSDLDFLRFGLQQVATGGRGLPEELATALADRLVGLGFAEPAMALLKAPASDAFARERRVLRARAALALDLPNRALVELLGLTGPDADRLRAEAMVRTGDLGQAAQAFLGAGAPEDAARGLWLSGAETLEPGLETTRYGQVADIAARLAVPPVATAAVDPDGDIPPSAPLREARDLIARSSETRGEILQLLALVDGANQQE